MLVSLQKGIVFDSDEVVLLEVVVLKAEMLRGEPDDYVLRASFYSGLQAPVFYGTYDECLNAIATYRLLVPDGNDWKPSDASVLAKAVEVLSETLQTLRCMNNPIIYTSSDKFRDRCREEFTSPVEGVVSPEDIAARTGTIPYLDTKEDDNEPAG